MSLDKHLNLLYSGTTPLNLGDRYYSQDLIRDLLYSWDNTGQTARRILGTFPALLMGGVVTVGAGAHCLDITEAWGVCNYSVEHPNTFAALPPSKSSSDIARLVHAASQNELDTSGLTTPATADGATPNYVKLRYAEANGNTRTRARAAGTYSYEVTPSYTYYCDAVAPTDYDVLLATVTITAPGVVTIVSLATPYNLKKAYDDLDVLETIYGTSTETIAAASATRTILDTDTVHTFFADCSQRSQTLVLPTLAANLGKIYTLQIATAGGWAKMSGEGAETINGIASFIMYLAGDHISVIGQTGGWKILTSHSTYDTGWINTADWTNRHLGTMQVVTKTSDSSAYTIGELLTEETTGNTFRLDTCSGGVGGTFIVRAISGTGFFTIDKKLTGTTSGINTIQVNATTKDQDNNIIHNFGYDPSRLKTKVWYNATATMVGAHSMNLESNTILAVYVGSRILNLLGVDTNNIKIQTGLEGAGYVPADDGTAATAIDTDDTYYRAITEVCI